MKEIPFFDQILSFKKIDSTFTRARNLIVNREVQGNFLLVAEMQTHGKGRNDNQWFSPREGLWFTAGFFNLPLRSSITIYLALCIVEAISTLYRETNDELAIKWPNDIMLKDKKLGGILTSAYPDLKYILSGVGLNTNNTELPPQLDNKTASLTLFLNKKIDNQELLVQIFESFAQGLPDYLEHELEHYKNLYNEKLSFLKNKRIVLKTEYEELSGLAKGINNQGALILQLENGSFLPIYSGSITHLSD